MNFSVSALRPSHAAVRVVYALTMVLGVAAVIAAFLLIDAAPDRNTDFKIFYRSALAWRHGPKITDSQIGSHP